MNNYQKGEPSISLALVTVIFIFIVLGCANSNKNNTVTISNAVNENTNAAANASQNSNAPKTIKETEEFKNLSSAEHLVEAKKIYNDKPSDYDLYVAVVHLKAIPDNAAEYTEAQAILKQIEKKASIKNEDEKNDADALQVVSSNWHKGAFGVAGIWNVTFYNKSDQPVGDIKYETRYFSESGNDLGGTGGVFTSGEVQKIIPPKQKRTVKINDGFINREAAKANFKITGWRFIEQ